MSDIVHLLAATATTTYVCRHGIILFIRFIVQQLFVCKETATFIDYNIDISTGVVVFAGCTVITAMVAIV